jgi:peptidoglycan/xylan/chitin deacetylase (PgdA/CDA1 family)
MRDGFFVLSFDFELIWGTLDICGPQGFARQCETERTVVVDRLLAFLATHGLPSTWFVVGHLLLDRCAPQGGVKHPEIVRPRHAWVQGDWFTHDPGSDEAAAPHYYGRALVEKILSCGTPQEIGAHSFSHVIFGDPGCSREAAQSELAACVSAARALGLTMRSFAFPRNSVGHLDLLPAHGFSCFRGPDPTWYESWPHAARRAAHLWDVAWAAAPPIVQPVRVADGLWNIPGSMVYLPRHGVRRFIPMSRRVKRAMEGLDRARRGGIFHLWMHPTNLVDDLEGMFSGLERILERVARLRDAGDIRVATVGELAAHAAGQGA